MIRTNQVVAVTINPLNFHTVNIIKC